MKLSSFFGNILNFVNCVTLVFADHEDMADCIKQNSDFKNMNPEEKAEKKQIGLALLTMFAQNQSPFK